MSKDKNAMYFVQNGFHPIVALNYGPGLIVSKEKLSPKFYKKLTTKQEQVVNCTFILTISFLTLGKHSVIL